MKENEIQKTQMKQEISVQRELEQAETAGEKALWSLYIARDTLNSAKKWGMVDLFGGGLITDFIKPFENGFGRTPACSGKERFGSL